LPKSISEKEIRESRQRRIIYDTKSSYALVTNIDLRFSPKITVYSLTKGTEEKFKINKETFKKFPLQYQDVVDLVNFKRKPKFAKQGGEFVEIPNQFDWWITDYSVVTDFSNFKRKVYE